jgi:CubicO group peptidase (beta-lactamase class C family)
MSGRFRKRWLGFVALALLVAGGAALALRPVAATRGPIFPGKHWSWKAPEKAGFSMHALHDYSRRVGGIGCVVHGGEMIYAWGDVSFRNDVASSCKPIYAHLVLQAVQDGRIESLDEPVVRWVPELAELNPDLAYKDREITFRHLLGQISGYGLRERPGEAFAYNDYATGLLMWTLFYRVCDLPPARYDEALNGPWLGEALGFEDRPTATHPNSPRGRIRISARDMARFMLLYLRGGVWSGKRLVRADLCREALGSGLPLDLPRTAGLDADVLPLEWKSFGGGKDEKNHLGCVKNYWWSNRITPDGARLLPDAPPGTFMGSGYGGRFAMVAIPERDLVAVWLGVFPGIDKSAWSPFSEVGRFHVNDLLRELLAAQTGTPK